MRNSAFKPLVFLLATSQVLASTAAVAATYEFHRHVPRLAVTTPPASGGGTSGGGTSSGEGSSPTGSALLQTSTSSLTFDGVTVNTTSDAQTALVFNNGTASGSVSGVQITGAGASQFAASTDCSAPLAAGSGSCHVSVAFTPSSTAPASATLTIATTSGDLTVGLSGQGVAAAAPGALGEFPSSLTFDTTNIGNTQTQYLTLSNTGGQALQLDSFSVSGSGFSLTAASCTGSLPAGSSCTVSVHFSPLSETSYASTLSFQAGAATHQISLAGQGVYRGASSSAWSRFLINSWTTPATAFTAAPVGQTATLTVDLRNTGSQGRLAAAFALVGDTQHFSLSVAPRKRQDNGLGLASCGSTLAADGLSATACTAEEVGSSTEAYSNIEVVVRFTPLAAGNFSVQLVPTTPNGSTLPAALTFTGTGQVLAPNGSVTLNGLTYTKNNATAKKSYTSAVAYCQSLTDAGGGWQLPTYTQLEAARASVTTRNLMSSSGWGGLYNGGTSTTYMTWTQTASGGGYKTVNVLSDKSASASTVDLQTGNTLYVTCVKAL